MSTKIKADITSFAAMDCLEKDCPWDCVCANHCSAGDYRMEGGITPDVYIEKGKVFCNTKWKRGNGFKPHEEPVDTLADGALLVKDIPIRNTSASSEEYIGSCP